jgi:hypothetical protein
VAHHQSSTSALLPSVLLLCCCCCSCGASVTCCTMPFLQSNAYYCSACMRFLAVLLSLQLWRISDLLYLPEDQVVAELEAHRCEACCKKSITWRCYAAVWWQHMGKVGSRWLAAPHLSVCAMCASVCVLLLGECLSSRRRQGYNHTGRAEVTCSCCTCLKTKWWRSWRHTGAKHVAKSVTWRYYPAVWWQHVVETWSRWLAAAHLFVLCVLLFVCCCWRHTCAAATNTCCLVLSLQCSHRGSGCVLLRRGSRTQHMEQGPHGLLWHIYLFVPCVLLFACCCWVSASVLLFACCCWVSASVLLFACCCWVSVAG